MNKIYPLIIVFLFMTLDSHIIFDFKKNVDLSSWRIVDDVVMGGRSDGNFRINNDGNAEFSGTVSLANNGGFSSVRHQFKSKELKDFTKIVLVVKGDGKKYQFRIKNNSRDYYSYIKYFLTKNEEWQTIELVLSDMYPTFRGRKLNLENFSSSSIEEIAILIGNKRNESFKLEIDKIYLK